MTRQLDLFQEAPRNGILYDMKLAGYMWRVVLHADDGMNIALYRGLIDESGRYYPVSACHLAGMKYTTDRDQIRRNVEAVEAFIASGKSACNSELVHDGKIVEALP